MTREIIVADNGSSDNTVALAQRTTAKVVVKEQILIGALRNFGVSHAQGDLVAFVDADCLVSRQWLQAAVACLAREAATAVGSHHTLPPEAGWLAKTGGIVRSYKVGAMATYIPSGNLIVAREAFSAVGGFDESLVTNEDVDFCRRLLQNGYKIFADPQIVAIHLGYPQGIGPMIVREMWHGQNTMTLFVRELKNLVNSQIVLFSLINLILLLAIVFSAGLFFGGSIIPFFSCGCLFIAFNICAALKKCGDDLANLPRVIFYLIIYGLGRSLGMVRFLFSCCSIVCLLNNKK
jgi:GT2 family glycosyltransferase